MFKKKSFSNPFDLATPSHRIKYIKNHINPVDKLDEFGAYFLETVILPGIMVIMLTSLFETLHPYTWYFFFTLFLVINVMYIISLDKTAPRKTQGWLYDKSADTIQIIDIRNDIPFEFSISDVRKITYSPSDNYSMNYVELQLKICNQNKTFIQKLLDIPYTTKTIRTSKEDADYLYGIIEYILLRP